ncbi:VOC family protein [Zhouia sp. PK063]|uniref:VOC family protein n=1 Tax=Zhouia sp. PK063 TaxID=3373602 RepID=UPI00379F6CF5
MKVNPYLNFDGNAEEAFLFYKTVFGGEFLGPIHKMKDVPGVENLSEEEKNKVMHICLKITDDVALMASDILPSAGHVLTKGNNNYISLHPDSKEEATKLFKGLSDGGVLEMDIQDTFWGAYFGSFTDKFGVKWMINYSYENEQ